MSTRCERGVHDFREAYDEVPHPTTATVKMDYCTAEDLRAMLVYKVVKAIYCKRCGKQLPLDSETTL